MTWGRGDQGVCFWGMGTSRCGQEYMGGLRGVTSKLSKLTLSGFRPEDLTVAAGVRTEQPQPHQLQVGAAGQASSGPRRPYTGRRTPGPASGGEHRRGDLSDHTPAPAGLLCALPVRTVPDGRDCVRRAPCWSTVRVCHRSTLRFTPSSGVV